MGCDMIRDSLTHREKLAASLAATGWSNEEMAQQMSIKKTTVEQYMHRIYDKTGVSRERLGEVIKAKPQTL